MYYSLNKFRISIILLIIVTLCGCNIPEQFDVALDINNDNSFVFKYSGTIVNYMVLEDIANGKFNKKKENEYIQELKALLEKEGFKNVQYKSNGRFQVNYEYSGKLEKNWKFGEYFALHKDQFGVIEIQAQNLNYISQKDLEKLGLSINGKISITTDADVISHNGEKSAPLFGKGGYAWRIKSINDPIPEMEIATFNYKLTNKEDKDNIIKLLSSLHENIIKKDGKGFVSLLDKSVIKDNQEAGQFISQFEKFSTVTDIIDGFQFYAKRAQYFVRMQDVKPETTNNSLFCLPVMGYVNNAFRQECAPLIVIKSSDNRFLMYKNLSSLELSDLKKHLNFVSQQIKDDNCYNGAKTFYEIFNKTTNPKYLGNLASTYATCSDQFADGKRSVYYIEKAVTLDAGWEKDEESQRFYYKTLATSYARNGQYDKAINNQEKFIKTLEALKKEKMSEAELTNINKSVLNQQKILELFKKKKPYTNPTAK